MSLEKAHELTISKRTTSKSESNGWHTSDRHKRIINDSNGSKETTDRTKEKNGRRKTAVREAVDMASEKSWLQQCAIGVQGIKRNEISRKGWLKVKSTNRGKQKKNNNE